MGIKKTTKMKFSSILCMAALLGHTNAFISLFGIQDSDLLMGKDMTIAEQWEQKTRETFDAMDIDEDGKVYKAEFKMYWTNYLKEKWGWTPTETVLKQYTKVFQNIAGNKKYFTWKDFRKWSTEVDVEYEKK